MPRTRLSKTSRSTGTRAGAFFALLLPVLLGCAQTEPTVVRIWTNTPSVLEYAAAYNARSVGTVVEVRSVSDPFAELAHASTPPDLIIAPNLNRATAETRFADLGGVVDAGEGARRFYDGFLSSGRINGTQRLVPIAFDLTGMIFAAGFEPEETNRLYADIHDIRDAAGRFNRHTDTRATHLGYGPTWSPEFLMQLAELFQVNFRQGPQEFPLWSREPLRTTLEFAVEWTEQLNGGFEIEQEFRRRYLTRPTDRLLKDGRIAFDLMRAGDYYRLSDAERHGLDIRWIRAGGAVTVHNSAVYAAVPRRSNNRDAATDLLIWLTDRAVQQELLEAGRAENEPVFGIAGGFSSLQRVNERDLPQLHPEMVGRIPPPELLQWPSTMHLLWPQMREDVVKPWLLEVVSSGTPDASPRDRIDSWLRQQERF